MFILVDELDWIDDGCYGSKYYETPNIDKLCNNGVKFTNGYAACAVCSPTRASIMTGCYPDSIIREGDWKLIRHYEDNQLELYNLKEDIGEQNNLVNQIPEKVQNMDAALSQWLKEVDAKLLKKNPDYNCY